jgi:uncharacterized protein (DUF58 family)
MSLVTEKSLEVYERMDSMNRVLNQDFCPGFNKWVYWIKHPFWCCLLAIGASLLCGLLVNTAVLGLSLILAIILVLGTIWPIVAMRGIECKLNINQHRVRVGQSLDLGVTITNRWPWPIWGLQLKSADGELQTTALTSIKAWSKTEITWHITAMQRGEFPSQLPSIETGFPFGLYHARKPIMLDHVVLVWPKVFALDALPDTADSQEGAERFSDRQVGEFGDLMGTRLFRQGDSLRHIHWAQTARSGEMIVCERQAPCTTAITLHTDFSSRSHNISLTKRSLEAAISLTASICEYLHREHGLVVCQIGNTYFKCGRSEIEIRQLMDALAKIPLQGIDDSQPVKSTSPTRHQLPGTRISIITDLSQSAKLLQQKWQKYIVVQTGTANTNANSGISPNLIVDASAEEICRVWRKVCHA